MAVVLSLTVLFYSVESWRGKRAWNQVTSQLIRHGESMDPKTFLPPAVSPQQDFAQAPIFSPLTRSTPGMKIDKARMIQADSEPLKLILYWFENALMRQSGIGFAPWLQAQTTDLEPWLGLCQKALDAPHASAQKDRRDIAAEILRILSPLDNLMDELRVYSDRPYCRLPFNYDLPMFSDDPSERILLAFLRVLRLRATAELALHRNDRAFQDLQLALRLAEYLRQQPSLFFHDPRAWAFADGLQPLWEAIQEHRWNARQLEAIQRQLLTFKPLADYPDRLRFIAFANALFVETIIPTRPVETGHPDFGPEGQSEIRWLRRFYPKGWSLQDQAAIYQQWLKSRVPPPPESPFPSHSAGDSLFVRQLLRGSSDPFFPIFLVPRIVQMQSDLNEFMPFMQAVTDLAALACAMERFRLVHSAYPETLDLLVPAFLDQLPTDCMSNAPMQYRYVDRQSCVLYSVGLDRQDNGGQASPRQQNWQGELQPEFDLSKNDWVWSLHTSNSPPQ